MMKNHRYTQDQKDFIGSICDGLPVDEIRERFIKKYDVEVTRKSITGIMYRNGYKNHMQGYETRLKKGHKAWSKGMKGLQLGGDKGWFKKGHTPPHFRELGSERIMNGYVWIKVANPDVFKRKHIYLWEQANCKIPPGKAVGFADGNKMNVTLENLFIASQGACTSVTRRKVGNKDPEINKTIHKLTELEIAIKKIETNNR